MRLYLRIVAIGLFFFYQFGLNNILMVLAQPISHTFNLTPSALGWLGSLYFWGDIFFLLPAGWLLDHYSTRKVVLTVMGLSIVLVLFSALLPNIYIFSVTRILEGACGSFGLIGALKLNNFYVARNKMAVMSGIVNTLGMLGSFIMVLPLSIVIKFFNWQIALTLVALYGLLILLVLFCSTHKKPDYCNEPFELVAFNKIFKFFLQPQILFNALYVCLVNLPIYILAALWGVPMLTHVLHVPQSVAALVTSFLFVGNMIGGPVFGYVSDRFKKRKIYLYLGVLLGMFIFLLLSLGLIHIINAAILFLLIGFTTSSQILAFAVVLDQYPKHLSGSVTAVVAMLSALGGALGQPLFGMLLSWFENKGLAVNAAYLKINYLFIVALILAGLCVRKIKSN